MIAAVEVVRERACRAAGARRQAGIPHIVAGGHAVASRVALVNKEAVRNAKDVDLMVLREDIPRVIHVLQAHSVVAPPETAFRVPVGQAPSPAARREERRNLLSRHGVLCGACDMGVGLQGVQSIIRAWTRVRG
jgi:hypothetical protein